MTQQPSRLALALAIGSTLALACSQPEPAAKVQEPAAAPAVADQATDGERRPAYCAEIRQCTDCPNDQFIPTDCWTTPYGPARANVVTVQEGNNALTATNMLYCATGPYALCFFSGPPTPTGKSGADNPPLPCVLNEAGDTALCTCRAYSSGANFVDIHAIGNLRVYYQTVDLCGHEGEKCQNIHNCGQDGSKEGCADFAVPPVCAFVQNQDPTNDAISLIPGAELISTFSFAMDDDYQLGNTECPNDDHGPYAGCMTAPCNFPLGRPAGPYSGNPIECKCPIWNGPYQIGQTFPPTTPPTDHCTIPVGAKGESYVWSAAYTVVPSKSAAAASP